ncbi:PaaI family thioesterase [Corynebacterium qintianiae]|uniref:PaaI family thioesterase n=1 Tax=Corynebacterium qintianiae TaxID=2709392 RepID=UPI0013EABBF4|nr:PaaI family thioesterase [Corynebacterium qintianiae]
MDHRFGTMPIKAPLSDEELAGVNSTNRGLAETLGIRISYVDGERTEGYVDVTPDHHQITGIANGGLYCAIGETLGSIAAVAASGAVAVGMNNNTDLLGSVAEGRIDAVALPVHVGKSTHLWRVEMYHEAKLVATTNLKLMVLRDRS